MRTRLKRAMTELKARRSQMKQAETHEARSDLVAILGDLCEKVGDLTKEMGELRSIAEQSLMESRRNREERSRVADLHDEEEIDRVRADVSRRSASPPPVETFPSQLRQGLHAAAATAPSLMPPSAAAPTRLVDTGDMPEPAASPSPPARTQPLRNVAILSPTHSDRSDTSARCRRREREGPESPFPSIRQEDEFEFFSPRRQQAKRAAAHDYDVANPDETARKIMVDLEDRNTLPPKAVLERVIRGLEDEFAHCKRCFGELADQYKVLDAMSMKTKQRVLGENLKETIDKMDRKVSNKSNEVEGLGLTDFPGIPDPGPRLPPQIRVAQRAEPPGRERRRHVARRARLAA
jgi:hypothetical protein